MSAPIVRVRGSFPPPSPVALATKMVGVLVAGDLRVDVFAWSDTYVSTGNTGWGEDKIRLAARAGAAAMLHLNGATHVAPESLRALADELEAMLADAHPGAGEGS